MKEATIFGPPENCLEIDLGMSNFDHAIDEGFEPALRSGDVFGRHAGLEFNGKVWYEYVADKFHEQVWRFGVPMATYSASNLKDLMWIVNEDWGWE